MRALHVVDMSIIYKDPNFTLGGETRGDELIKGCVCDANEMVGDEIHCKPHGTRVFRCCCWWWWHMHNCLFYTLLSCVFVFSKFQ